MTECDHILCVNYDYHEGGAEIRASEVDASWVMDRSVSTVYSYCPECGEKLDSDTTSEGQ